MTPSSHRQGRLARRVHFSSGHQYYNPKFDENKNRQLFGSCFSKHGHGHNYILEAYFEGPNCEDTGMIINLRTIDSLMKEVVAPLDHHHLNLDVEEFKTKIPTTENIAYYCFHKIQNRLKEHSVQLFKVRVFEGDDLWVDYTQKSDLIE